MYALMDEWMNESPQMSDLRGYIKIMFKYTNWGHIIIILTSAKKMSHKWTNATYCWAEIQTRFYMEVFRNEP